jgi:hypothetical protein
LASLRNRDVFRNGERRTWLQSRDSALGSRLLLAATAAVVIRRGNGPLACQLALDLLAYSLYTYMSMSGELYERLEATHLIPLRLFLPRLREAVTGQRRHGGWVTRRWQRRSSMVSERQR